MAPAPFSIRISVYSRAAAVKSLEPVSLPQTVTIFSPAKINLFLAVIGRRPDGYHNLVSVAAPLDFGDQLMAEVGAQRPDTGRQFSLECDDPEVPAGGDNLVVQAAEAFAEATGWRGAAAFGWPSAFRWARALAAAAATRWRRCSP